MNPHIIRNALENEQTVAFIFKCQEYEIYKTYCYNYHSKACVSSSRVLMEACVVTPPTESNGQKPTINFTFLLLQVFKILATVHAECQVVPGKIHILFMLE